MVPRPETHMLSVPPSRPLGLVVVAALMLAVQRGAPGTKHHAGVGDVFPSMSMSLEKEVALIAELTGLKPGMTFADVGGGNGLFISKIGRSVMPGGHLIGTGSNMHEANAILEAARTLDASAEAFVGTVEASGLTAGCCDVIQLRMVYLD